MRDLLQAIDERINVSRGDLTMPESGYELVTCEACKGKGKHFVLAPGSFRTTRECGLCAGNGSVWMYRYPWEIVQ